MQSSKAGSQAARMPRRHAPGVVAQAGDRITRVVYLDGIVPVAGKSVGEPMGYMSAEDAAG